MQLKNRVGISRSILVLMLTITFMAVFAVAAVWTLSEYRRFQQESDVLRKEFVASRKKMIRKEVDDALEYIQYERQQSETLLETVLRRRTENAHKMAFHLFRTYQSTLPDSQLQKLVTESLRPIRFDREKNHYFIINREGEVILFPEKPEMEGQLLFSGKPSAEASEMIEMLNIGVQEKEGFYRTSPQKGFAGEKNFPALVFVKWFAPFQWVIGTLVNPEIREKELQREILSRLAAIRFDDGGYLFGSTFDGDPLFTNGKITVGTGSVWNLTDPDGVKIIQEQSRVSQTKGSGFVKYSWIKLKKGPPSPKISYVRGYPEWKWTIGAGCYVDEIESVISQKQQKLYESVEKSIFQILMIMLAVFGVIVVVVRFVSGRIHKNVESFIAFFSKAAGTAAEIDPGKLFFRDFSRLAQAANRMIRERKFAQEALRISESRYRALFEHMSDGVAIYKPRNDGKDFIFFDFNRAGEKIDHVQKEAIIGKSLLETYPGVKEFGLYDVLKRVWETGEPEHHPVRMYQDERITGWRKNYIYKLPSGEIVAMYSDETERMEAERELRENEKKFRMLVENMPVLVNATDENSMFIFWNRECEKVTGYSAEEIIGNPDAYAWLYPDESYLDTLLRRWGESGNDFMNWEITLKARDGSLKTISWSNISGIYSIKGWKSWSIGIDVTERVLAIKALEQAGDRQKAILNSINDGFFTLNKEMKLTYYNRAAEELLGRNLENLLGKNLFEGFPEAAGSIFEEKYTKALRERTPLKFETYFGISPFENWYDVNVYPFEDGISVFFQITTDKKEAEIAIRENEKRFRLVLDAVSDGVWDWNLKTNEVFYSNRFLEALGFKRKEIQENKTFWENLLHEDDKKQVLEHLEAHLSGKTQTYECEYRMQKKNGDFRHTLDRGKIVDYGYDGNPVRMVGTLMDITERKTSEAQQKILEKKLQQAQKMEAIGTLAGGIAHDFNNILFPIMGYTELAMDMAEEGSEIFESLEEVMTAAKRAKALVRQILAFSRDAEAEYRPVYLQPIVKEVMRLLRSTIPTTIYFEKDVDENCGAILAEPTQIHQILMNLCTNSYHAMEETGGVLRVELAALNLEEGDMYARMNLSPGRYARLTVSDTGCGIPKAVLDKIFEPYYTTKQMGKGTGLGLSVVHGIVRAHGGAVTVYSEPGKGTLFHVYLPIVDTDDMAADDGEGLITGNEHILLVDDEEQVVKVVTQMLLRMGYRVTSASGSVEALDIIHHNKDQFHLVITDLTMPEITGLELAAQIKNIRPDIPVIISTGFSERINEENAKNMGVDGLIMKPVIRKELSLAIREILDKNNDNQPE